MRTRTRTRTRTLSRRGHAPGFLVPRDVGQGKFHLLENIRALPTHETIPMWWTASGFLCALLVMNLVWSASSQASSESVLSQY